MTAILPSLFVTPDRRERLAARFDLRPLAPATLLGVQEGFGPVPDIELWNLTADIPGYKAGGTVSRGTLIEAGFRLPAR